MRPRQQGRAGGTPRMDDGLIRPTASRPGIPTTVAREFRRTMMNTKRRVSLGCMRQTNMYNCSPNQGYQQNYGPGVLETKDDNEWITQERFLGEEEKHADGSVTATGTSDMVFRHEFDTWLSYMTDKEAA